MIIYTSSLYMEVTIKSLGDDWLHTQNFKTLNPENQKISLVFFREEAF